MPPLRGWSAVMLSALFAHEWVASPGTQGGKLPQPLEIPQPESSTPIAKFPLDLDPLSVYISVFHGRPDAPGVFFVSNHLLGKQIQ